MNYKEIFLKIWRFIPTDVTWATNTNIYKEQLKMNCHKTSQLPGVNIDEVKPSSPQMANLFRKQ